MHEAEGCVKVRTAGEHAMVGPDRKIIFLHEFTGRNRNIASARNHPSDNADAIREHNRALGGHFPKLSGEDSVLKGQNECQGDDVGCMGMIDDSVRTVAGDLFDLMVHQMAGQFAGRSAAVDQSPENSVILTLVIQFDDA